MQTAAQKKILQTSKGIQLLGYYSPQKKNPSQGLVIMLLGILNLSHWELFEIWFLVLGIFMIFLKQVNFATIG